MPFVFNLRFNNIDIRNVRNIEKRLQICSQFYKIIGYIHCTISLKYLFCKYFGSKKYFIPLIRQKIKHEHTSQQIK